MLETAIASARVNRHDRAEAHVQADHAVIALADSAGGTAGAAAAAEAVMVAARAGGNGERRGRAATHAS